MRRMDSGLSSAIKWLVVLGFFTLPYTHLAWMPDLGLTRPVSSVLFALAFGLVALQAFTHNGLRWKDWLNWPKSWDQWPVLRWWLYLIVLGVLSAAITPFYGLPKEALTRLLGYIAIFVMLFMAAYSLPRYGIQRIARWTMLGYLPALAYAIVEALAILNLAWATQIILWFRSNLIVQFTWAHRISLFATEPSFVGFQLVILLFLLPYVIDKWLQICGWALVIICLVFTQSGTVVGLIMVYLVLWGLFSLKRRFLMRMAAGVTGVGGMAILISALVPQMQLAINKLASALLSIDRLKNMSISVQIRLAYLLNLVYAIRDSYGLGLGIGQYGYFWKDIYLRHIDYHQFDIYGEVNRALTVPGDYMKPWSVILGIGADLGLAGLALLGLFFWHVYRDLVGPRHKALFVTCLVGLAGAYPIVTPHLWLVLALMAGMGLQQKMEKVPA